MIIFPAVVNALSFFPATTMEKLLLLPSYAITAMLFAVWNATLRSSQASSLEKFVIMVVYAEIASVYVVFVENIFVLDSLTNASFAVTTSTVEHNVPIAVTLASMLVG